MNQIGQSEGVLKSGLCVVRGNAAFERDVSILPSLPLSVFRFTPTVNLSLSWMFWLHLAFILYILNVYHVYL